MVGAAALGRLRPPEQGEAAEPEGSPTVAVVAAAVVDVGVAAGAVVAAVDVGVGVAAAAVLSYEAALRRLHREVEVGTSTLEVAGESLAPPPPVC